MIDYSVIRWGPQLEQATYKNRQRLYLSEQASFLFILYEFFFPSRTSETSIILLDKMLSFLFWQ